MNIFNKITRECLKKNRTRTIVTIIGVILSVAMITGVTTLVSSFTDYMARLEIKDTGEWLACLKSPKSDACKSLEENSKVEKTGYSKEIGFTKLEGFEDYGKYFMYIKAYDSAAVPLAGIKVEEGRLPKNDSEIIVSNWMMSRDDVKAPFKIGDKVTFEIGDRISDGYKLSIDNPYLNAESGEEDEYGNKKELEEWKSREKKTYTIVGYAVGSFSELVNNTPAYLAYTYADTIDVEDDNNASMYVKTKSPRQIKKVCDGADCKDVEYNDSVLRYYGMSDNDNFNKVFNNLAIILIVLIAIGSISLIYNAFSISVSDRRKQFGLLSGVGATKKQLAASVIYEAVCISGVGIALGLLAGIGGIAVTLKFVGNIISQLSTTNEVKLTLYITPTALIVAVIVGFVVVLISAFIPSRRAAKTSVIEAIRQNNDIKINPKKVKTSKLTYKLFGLEGSIASKNFKRNKKKYRSTVLSLFISIVLFVSASSFTQYMEVSSGSVIENYKFDLNCSVEDKNYDELQKDYKKLCAADGVKEHAFLINRYTFTKISKDDLTKEYIDTLDNANFTDNDSKYVNSIAVLTVPDEEFKDNVKEIKADADKYMSTDSLRCIVFNSGTKYDQNEQRYVKLKTFTKDSIDAEIGYYDIFGDKKEAQEYKDVKKTSITCDIFTTENVPMGIDNYVKYGEMVMMIPYSVYDFAVKNSLLGHEKDNMHANLYFSAEDPTKTSDEMYDIMSDKWSGNKNEIYNIAEALEENRKIILIVDLFAYGFIALISLISLANVFNTISTNVILRRREFAMLKSVGMTEHGFNKMMNYECLLYGLKSLILGLPVSCVMSYLIYKSIGEGMDTEFMLPYKSIGICVLCVFMVVFSTMIYSMSKIKKQNIIETLKNDNI